MGTNFSETLTKLFRSSISLDFFIIQEFLSGVLPTGARLFHLPMTPERIRVALVVSSLDLQLMHKRAWGTASNLGSEIGSPHSRHSP
jgi:hypothetical protein